MPSVYSSITLCRNGTDVLKMCMKKFNDEKIIFC